VFLAKNKLKKLHSVALKHQWEKSLVRCKLQKLEIKVGINGLHCYLKLFFFPDTETVWLKSLTFFQCKLGIGHQCKKRGQGLVELGLWRVKTCNYGNGRDIYQTYSKLVYNTTHWSSQPISHYTLVQQNN